MSGMDWKILLLAHSLVSLLFILLNLRGKSRLRALSEAVLVFCVPVAGLLIMCSFKAAGSMLKLWQVYSPEPEKERETLFWGAPVKKDVVPLNDVYLVEDKLKKRSFFTESIKQSMIENQQILKMAVHDKDREVAYYAVSILTSRMEKLETELFERESSVLKGEQEETLPLLEEYAELLQEYLGNKAFIDHVSWRKKQEIYIGVLDRLARLSRDKREYFREEVHQLLLLPDYRGAEQVCEAFAKAYPEDEAPYLSYMALYAAWKKPERMRENLRRLKSLPGELSAEAQQVVDFWGEEASSLG